MPTRPQEEYQTRLDSITLDCLLLDNFKGLTISYHRRAVTGHRPTPLLLGCGRRCRRHIRNTRREILRFLGERRTLSHQRRLRVHDRL